MENHCSWAEKNLGQSRELCADVPPGRCSVRCPAQARGYPRTMLPVPSPCMHSPARGEERRPGAGGSAARPDSEPRARRRRPVRGDRQRCAGEPVRRPPFSGCARHGATGRPWQRRHRLITGTSVRRPAPRLGTPQSTKVAEGNTGGPLRQREEEKRQREEDAVPRAGAGGDWSSLLGTGVDGISNTVHRPVSYLLPFFDPNRDEKF